jgi:hypothetical protein
MQPSQRLLDLITQIFPIAVDKAGGGVVQANIEWKPNGGADAIAVYY